MWSNAWNLRFILLSALVACIVSACGTNNALMSPTSPANGGSNAGAQAIDDHAQISPNSTGSPTPKPSPPNLWTSPGLISGLDDQFNPVDGNTDSYNGQPIDNAPCQPSMSNIYHVHAFVGIYVNGVHYAIPDTIGMFNPAPEPKNHFTPKAQCYYDVHLHDASGIVHVESKDPQHVPITGTIYNSKQLFDEWGITVNADQFGPFTGQLVVYTSGQVYRGGPGNGVVYRSTYTQWTGDPNAIPIYSHEVLFFEIGPKYVPVLPNVIFYSEF